MGQGTFEILSPSDSELASFQEQSPMVLSISMNGIPLIDFKLTLNSFALNSQG